MKNSLMVLVLVLLIINCDNSNKRATYAKNSDVLEAQTHPGKKLMETHCYACHNATTSEADRIAPPMIAIKMRYINSVTSKKEFVADMQKWIKEPIESNAKMYGAVKRFGMMQKLPYPENVIEQIADYIFDNDIEQPERFQEHFNQNKGCMRPN
ncbi:c-type cytochrome [Confluentibacter flavum]|uniref:Cytochrome c domain-containing protein n=1 Tax=Confluentibacter flavum TaxID=1909700 RepID=A0A2N3HMM0_9FLAO|nr:c-type cytochrome [Confluentibacter flavum]PKQ46181.1 hypothetical protein CSW08_03180 [Confluentibacter flavum]